MRILLLFSIALLSFNTFGQNPYINECRNLENGEHKSYYRNGQLQFVCTVINGRFDKEKISYYKNGNMEASISFNNGLLNGESNYFSKRGDTIGALMYHNDTLLSETDISYYRSGQLKHRWYYEFIHDSISPSWQNHENKSVRDGLNHISYRSKYFVYNYISKGYYIGYHKNGTVKMILNMSNGDYNGPGVSYYDNGVKKEDFYYKNGELDGILNKYNKEGQLIKTVKYLNGKKVKFK